MNLRQWWPPTRRRALVVGAVVLLIAVAVVVPLTLRSDPPESADWELPPSLAHSDVVIGDRLKDGIELVADAKPLTADDPAAAQRVATGELGLSVSLLRHLAEDASTTNVSVSPASLALALAMLQNGAAGDTAREIRDVLQTDGLSTVEQDAGYAALTAAWRDAADDGDITLDSANSLFLQRDFPVKPAFLGALKSYFDAGVWQVDYESQLADAIDTINAWTSENTHGKIKELFEHGQLDASTVAVLANALYFHAAWSAPFDPADSHEGDFHGAAGDSRPTFMAQTGDDLPWATGDGYQAVELPYRGDRFAALAVMPTSGTLPDFVAHLTPARLSAIASALHDGRATVSLPTFTTDSALSLADLLARLGMPDAFTDEADFSGLSRVPTRIAAVEQRVYLAVGEKGTEAAAATGADMAVSGAVAAGAELVFDHPFLFLVRDTVTGAILFASLVQHP